MSRDLIYKSKFWLVMVRRSGEADLELNAELLLNVRNEPVALLHSFLQKCLAGPPGFCVPEIQRGNEEFSTLRSLLASLSIVYWECSLEWIPERDQILMIFGLCWPHYPF